MVGLGLRGVAAATGLAAFAEAFALPRPLLVTGTRPCGAGATGAPTRSCSLQGAFARASDPIGLKGAFSAIAGLCALRWCCRGRATVAHGLTDRAKSTTSVKSAMIKKLGKLVLQKEFNMRAQIKEDPKLAERTGCTQEELLADFERAVQFLRTDVGCKELESDIAISKVATGLYMQNLGKPKIPTNDEMLTVMAWISDNLRANKEDGSLREIIEKYPFVLSRTVEDLEESKRFCPEDIDFDVAVADDPQLIDKTYNCDGICANQCTQCWYNG